MNYSGMLTCCGVALLALLALVLMLLLLLSSTFAVNTIFATVAKWVFLQAAYGVQVPLLLKL